MSIKKYLAAAAKESRTPLYLLFFVTARCDCQCRHCFFWRSTNQIPDELSLSEIEKIAASSGELLQLTLTGGDSVQRDDLPEIAKTFADHTGVRNITLATNGYRPERVLTLVRRTLDLVGPRTNITVDTSIDGLGEDHDAIRNRPGVFDNTVRTVRGLQEMQKEYPNLNTCVNTTVSFFNQDKLRPIHNFLVNELKPDIVNALCIRGEPRDPEAKKLDIERYHEICEWIKEDTAQNKIRGYNFFTDTLHAKDFLLRDLIIKTARTNRFQYPCTAARLTGVIYPQGDVAVCELLDVTLGNLRRENYDLERIWNSPRTEAIRRKIAYEKCFCVHQCFLSNNILFNPRLLPRLLTQTARLKVRRLAHRARRRR